MGDAEPHELDDLSSGRVWFDGTVDGVPIQVSIESGELSIVDGSNQLGPVSLAEAVKRVNDSFHITVDGRTMVFHPVDPKALGLHLYRATDMRSSGDATWESGTLVSAGVGAVAGALAGFVWGGVGGRLAMRIIFLSSDDRVRGLTSDDGFEIGRFSADTIFLLIFASFLGMAGGLGYGLIRMLLEGPRWLIAIAVGVAAAAAAGGGFIVQSDGIDFRLLGPLWLTVGLFLLIPGAWGVTVVLLTERLLRPGSSAEVSSPGTEKRPLGPVGSFAGWAVIAAITGLGLADLVRDVARLT